MHGYKDYIRAKDSTDNPVLLHVKYVNISKPSISGLSNCQPIWPAKWPSQQLI